MTYDQIIAAWNAQADHMNQWPVLSEQEKVEWARKCALDAAAKICDHQAASWGFHQVAPSAAHACAAAIRAICLKETRPAPAGPFYWSPDK